MANPPGRWFARLALRESLPPALRSAGHPAAPRPGPALSPPPTPGPKARSLSPPAERGHPTQGTPGDVALPSKSPRSRGPESRERANSGGQAQKTPLTLRPPQAGDRRVGRSVLRVAGECCWLLLLVGIWSAAAGPPNVTADRARPRRPPPQGPAAGGGRQACASGLVGLPSAGGRLVIRSAQERRRRCRQELPRTASGCSVSSLTVPFSCFMRY